jgi:hypothetical protein
MEEANTMIMAARAHWFDDEPEEGAAEDGEGEASAAAEEAEPT